MNCNIGILYLYRITEARVSNSVSRNIRMFEKIYGQDISRRIILTTTMWPDPNDRNYSQKAEEECNEHEQDLIDNYWNVMIAKGSRVIRFLNTPRSAQEVLNEVLCPTRK